MIALFVPTLGGGGAELNMVRLAGGLAARGHAVALVLVRAVGPLLQEIPAGVEVVDLASGRMGLSLLPLARFLRERQPHAMLSTPSHANVLAVWARALSGTSCRLVLREANTLSQTAAHSPRLSDRLLPGLVRWSYRRADAVVSVSQGVAEDLRRAAGISDVRAIPNPAVGPEIAARAREPLSHPWLTGEGAPVVLAVGRLAVQKDYPTLLRAFRRLRDRRPCRLLVLGEGPERPGLERLVAELGLTGEVALPGFAPNPFAYMARAGVLALSSRWEGWPNVCAQALAVGTPVVATDCPHGPAEILEGGRYGELVPVGDPAALADALARTLDAPPPREVLTARAGEFTLDRAVSAYAEVLGVRDP